MLAAFQCSQCAGLALRGYGRPQVKPETPGEGMDVSGQPGNVDCYRRIALRLQGRKNGREMN
jgi:hypothetical protein